VALLPQLSSVCSFSVQLIDSQPFYCFTTLQFCWFRTHLGQIRTPAIFYWMRAKTMMNRIIVNIQDQLF